MDINKGQTIFALKETVCEETVFDELQPGDRIRIAYGQVTDTREKQPEVIGTVLRTEHHPHYPKRSGDKNVNWPDNMILLETPTGEILAVTVGKTTVVRRA